MLKFATVKGPLNSDCKTEIAFPFRLIKLHSSIVQLQQVLMPTSGSIYPVETIQPGATPKLTQNSTQDCDYSPAFC